MTYNEFKKRVESTNDFYVAVGSNKNIYVFSKTCGNIMARIGFKPCDTRLDYFMNDNFSNQFYEEIIEFTKSRERKLNDL